MKTDQERITELEARIAQLEARLAIVESRPSAPPSPDLGLNHVSGYGVCSEIAGLRGIVKNVYCECNSVTLPLRR